MWGLGGLTFGLTMRYLGIALGMAIALGYCAAFGTLMPPIFSGEITEIIHQPSGQVILFGVVVCLAGIAISGLAGMSKEKELTAEQKKATIQEFSFVKGILVATFSGVMSASFAYGLAAGKPIAELAKAALERHEGRDLWQNLPVLVVVLWGGFTTNFIWCVILNWKNRSGHEYLALRKSVVAEVSATEGVVPWDADELAGTAANGGAATASNAVVNVESVPIVSNYLFSALAGTTWYLQFFFYSMGQTRMGKYEFSSWTLHMASIINLQHPVGRGVARMEGDQPAHHVLIAIGLAVLIFSTFIVGYGNFLKATPRRTSSDCGKLSAPHESLDPGTTAGSLAASSE